MSALKELMTNAIIDPDSNLPITSEGDSTLLDPNQIEPFNLPQLQNTLKHFIDTKRSMRNMFRHLVKGLERDNPQLANNMKSQARTLQICINCGNQESLDQEITALKLTNEKAEFSSLLSVTLRVIYIFEGDQYRKYELRLKPGEYSYQDVI